MSRVILKMAFGLLMTISLSACSSLPGSSMMSGLSPSRLNPFAAMSNTFTGQTEPALDDNAEFIESQFMAEDEPEVSTVEENAEAEETAMDFASEEAEPEAIQF